MSARRLATDRPMTRGHMWASLGPAHGSRRAGAGRLIGVEGWRAGVVAGGGRCALLARVLWGVSVLGLDNVRIKSVGLAYTRAQV
jgi:hypothetical protein